MCRVYKYASNALAAGETHVALGYEMSRAEPTENAKSAPAACSATDRVAGKKTKKIGRGCSRLPSSGEFFRKGLGNNSSGSGPCSLFCKCVFLPSFCIVALGRQPLGLKLMLLSTKLVARQRLEHSQLMRYGCRGEAKQASSLRIS